MQLPVSGVSRCENSNEAKISRILAKGQYFWKSGQF